MDPVPLLVTRPEFEQFPGRLCIHAPCLVFVPIEWDSSIFEVYRGQSLDILVTSPRGIEALKKLRLEAGWRVLALAPATVASAEKAGIHIDISCEGGAAKLAALSQPGPVVLLTSDLGGEEFLKVRPDGKVVAVYGSACPESLPEEALVAMQGVFDVFFASPSAAQHFNKLAPYGLERARKRFFRGRTTGEALENLGFTALSCSP
jgi:uroporphyrinogen-III synthase